MVEIAQHGTEIALDDFLPIFLSSTFVLIFGAVYVGFYTAVKAKILGVWAQPLAYVFWGLSAYMMYMMATLMHMSDLMQRILGMATLAYLILPHVIYYMMDNVHEVNEHGESGAASASVVSNTTN